VTCNYSRQLSAISLINFALNYTDETGTGHRHETDKPELVVWRPNCRFVTCFETEAEETRGELVSLLKMSSKVPCLSLSTTETHTLRSASSYVNRIFSSHDTISSRLGYLSAVIFRTCPTLRYLNGSFPVRWR
jgi:hypothetical protein